MYAFSQSSKTTDLLHEGIKTKDYAKIESALTKRASVNDGLLYSVMLGDSVFVKYFIQKEASPSYGLVESIKKNDIPITKYLLEKGANFDEIEIDEIEDKVSIFNKKENNDFIPVTFINSIGNKCWMMKDEKGSWNIPIRDKLESGYFFIYHTKKVPSGNPALIYAIRNNNLDMIKLLLQFGANAVNRTAINEFSGFISQTYDGNYTIESSECEIDHVNYSKNGRIETDRIPIPVVFMKPIEYAISINANIKIVEILQKNDSTKNYKLKTEKIVFQYENNCDSLVNVKNNEFGFTITKKKKNVDLYSIIYYSADNSSFKEINLFPHNEDFLNSNTDSLESVDRYFYNEFGDNYQPKEIILKIGLKHYTKFDDLNSGSFIDKRDGLSYKFVKIGTQIWMAQNLKYKIDDSFCHSRNNDSILYNTYGRLYSFEKAKNACPPGWHLPSVSEWEQLINHLGGKKVAPDKMIEEGIEHWELNKSATNSSGFSALPAGFCSCSTIGLDGNGVYGAWLVAEDGKLAFLLSGIIMVSKAYSGRYYSIRCLKDQ